MSSYEDIEYDAIDDEHFDALVTAHYDGLHDAYGDSADELECSECAAERERDFVEFVDETLG